MRIAGSLLLGVGCVVLLLGCGDGDGKGAGSTEGAVPTQAFVVDPAGDVAAGSKGDLSAASIVEEGDGLEIAVRFVPGEFDPAVSNVVVVMDIDTNPLTGDAEGSDGLGGDYIVEMGSACLEGKALLRRYDGTPWRSGPVDAYAVTVGADGFATTVPVAALEGYSGGFSFRVESSREIEACGYTPLLDSMPNEGAAPAVFP